MARSRCRRLGFETLESRQMLAADLELVDVQLTNAQGALISHTPAVGEKIYAVAHYRITDLTPADVYNISWTLDGVTTKQYDIAGFAGTDIDLTWYHGGFIAQPGASHVLTVTVDSDDTVAEANEANNSISIPITPDAATSLPNKFITPLAGTQNVDWVLGGYVDVNPKHFDDDNVDFFTDYQGNTPTTRDFHNGLDFPITNFAAQDSGVEVLAAAAGTVIEVRDGDFDRQTGLFNGDIGNYVFIDHGNGWVSQNWHLRRDSITVQVNDVVTAGQVLGLVGSSGNSGGPHLHFEIQHYDTPVDPFTAPDDYFVSPLPYVIDPVLPNNLLDFGVTNDIYDGVHTFLGPSFDHVREKVSDIDTFPTSPQEIYAWAIFSSVEAGDTWRALLYRPDGSLVNDFSNSMFTQLTDFEEDGDTDGLDFLVWQRGFGITEGAQRSDGNANPFADGAVDSTDRRLWQLQYGRTVINGWEWGWYRPGFTENIPGTWRVDFFYNDVKVGERTFEVGSAEPEMRVFEQSSNYIVIDDRTTPYNFGMVEQGATEPTMTFKVENHGYGDLVLSLVTVPTGFSVSEGLNATIAPGTSDIFTVRLDTAVVGVKSGQVVITGNDASEASYSFPVEGEVIAPFGALAASPEPPAPISFFFDESLLGDTGADTETYLAEPLPMEAAVVRTLAEDRIAVSSAGSTDRARVRELRLPAEEDEAADEVFELLGDEPLLA